MQKHLLVVVALVFSLASTQAQRVLLDFETESQAPGLCFGTGEDNTDCYSTIANPDPAGENTSANVLEFIEPAVGEPWMGMFFDIVNGGDMDLTIANGQTQLCADVWVPSANTVTFKVEKIAGNGDLLGEYEAPGVTPSVTGAWTTVCSDMAPFDDMGTRFVLFFNILATPANPITYYFDNLIQSGVSSVGGLIEAKGLKFYPNPATHDLFFNADGEPMTVIVSDLAGREMIRQNSFTGNSIRVSDLTPGMYTITFVDESTGQYGTAKFSKM